MDKVSVITVVYNRKEDLVKTMASVEEQDYPNLEYVVVDGGSTDGSLELIKEKAEAGLIHRWISEPDKGIYDAMNKAVRLASGDWVNFLNTGDVYVEKDTLSQIFAQRDLSHADLVYGDAYLEYDDHRILRPAVPVKNMWRVHPFVHQALFSRRALAEERPFDLSLSICADYDFSYSCYKDGKKFEHVPVPVSVNDFRYGATKVSYMRTFKQAMEVRKRYSSWWQVLYMRISVLKYHLKFGLLPKGVVRKIRTTRFKDD
jgi:glycosyltransferase involved in cell wall biosynthesis